MWLSKIGDSCPRFIGSGINVKSGNEYKLGNDTRVNINSKLEMNYKVVGWGHIHVQVQFYWNKNLPICQWVDIGQVQDFMVKLNLSQNLHDFDSWSLSI